MEINNKKCVDAKQFIEIINDCIETLEKLKEEFLKEIYYDEQL